MYKLDNTAQKDLATHPKPNTRIPTKLDKS